MARAARVVIVLCGGALISACAGFTQHVPDNGESSTVPAARGSSENEAAAIAVRYAVLPTAGSPYYDDRKARGGARASAQPRVGTPRGGLTRTTVVASQAHIAHIAPTLRGMMSDSGAASDSEQKLSHASSTSFDVSSIAFNVPTSMTLDRRTLIQLALAGAGEGGADGIASTATDAAAPAGQYIEAQLSGGDFVIEPVTAGTQALRAARPTEWLWLVTPTKPGRRHLQLTVTALTDTGDVPLRRAFPTFEHTVLVGTRWQDEVLARIETNAAWLWATLLAALLALSALYARRRRRHRRWFRSDP